jgi:2-polyprenyl-3-methyl-5-hydroxy-6-metoxy-1,4-benzoquinol methylase
MNRREISVDQLMQRVRAEAQGRWSEGSVAAASAVADQPMKDFEVPPPIQLALPDDTAPEFQPAFEPSGDGKYRLQELLDYHDRAFIYAAYGAVLGREPDEGGLVTYLRLLRSGTSKIEILGILRQSQEGVALATQVAGLSRQLAILRICRWPVIGPLVRTVIMVLRLPEMERDQRAVQGRLMALAEQAQVSGREYQVAITSAIRALETGLHRLTAFAASKPGRDALSHLEASIELANDSVARIRALIDKKADCAELQRSLERVNRSLQVLETRKVEQSALEEIRKHFIETLADKTGRSEFEERVASLHEARALLVRSVEAKADRHEFTAFANHFIDLLQARPTKDEIASLAQSQDALIKQGQSDREAAEASDAELRVSLARSQEALIKQARSDREAAETSAAEFRASLEYARVETGSTKALVAEAMTRVSESLADLSQSKADRIELEATSSALTTALASARAAAEQSLVAALANVNDGIKALAESKADRADFDVANAALGVSLDSARAEAQRILTTALTEVNSNLESLRNSKVDVAAAEAAQSYTKSLIETALNDLALKFAMISDNKADRVELERSQRDVKAAVVSAREDFQRALKSALDPLNSHTRDIKRNVLDQERRLSLLLEEARKRLPKPIAAKQIQAMLAEEDHVLDAMYASFEDIFRGSREDIKHRQAVYIPYVQAVTATVVDLGCGRGEWLENLRDAGLQAVGVDTNRVFLERCRELDLNVVESDAITYLRTLKPHSVGAITSFHLIEHLPHKALLACLDAAFQALRSGGIIILETPNPRNVQVGSCNFYLDPTHRQPLPPELVRYLAEARGFVQIEVKELHPFPSESLVTGGAPMVNDLLNRFFFSSQDYAVIAKKP